MQRQSTPANSFQQLLTHDSPLPDEVRAQLLELEDAVFDARAQLAECRRQCFTAVDDTLMAEHRLSRALSRAAEGVGNV
jgi:hypothetical protein